MRARDAWLRQGALLASACALMLAVGLAASVAAPRPVTLEVGREVGPGTYKIPFKDANGADMALVFTVPAGLRIKAQGAHSGGSCITGFCPPPGMMFEGKGETGDDKGFVFCLDFQTGADCGSGYPIARRAGDQTDTYGTPPGASASRAARAAKYGSLIDRIVASSHIEGAERDALMSISPDGTPAGPGTYEIEGVVFNVPDGALISIPYIEVQDCPEEYWCGPLIVIDDENSESWMALEIDTGVENYRIILPEGDAGARANALFDHIANSARLVASARIKGAPRCTEATLGGLRARNAALAVDCDALLAARHMLGGEGALNWSAGTPLAEWDGVTVAGAPPRVVGLDLRARGLSGAIPTQLGNLTALTSLDLSDNALTGSLSLAGSLPAGVRDLPPTLATLRLAGNPFTGCIDERLRLAATNDLATLMKERGLSWCPVAEMPVGGMSAGTYQYDGTYVIIDIPATGPRVKWNSTVIFDESVGSIGVILCLSDLDEREELCIDVIDGTEIRRRVIVPVPSPLDAVSGETTRKPMPGPAGLQAVFDKIVATARMPVPVR